MITATKKIQESTDHGRSESNLHDSTRKETKLDATRNSLKWDQKKLSNEES